MGKVIITVILEFFFFNYVTCVFKKIVISTCLVLFVSYNKYRPKRRYKKVREVFEIGYAM